LIAKFIGAGERHRISGAVHTAMAFSVVFGILFTILGQFTARPLLALIHTPEDIMTSATNYLKVYFLGVPFLSVYNFAHEKLQNRMKLNITYKNLAALILSGIINVLLNLFFVVVCKLSVIGVALATDISTAVSAFFVVFWLCREPDEFRLSVRKCRIEWKYLSSILRIGIPAAIQSAVFCVANIFVQSAINTFGSSAAAGSAISMNFEYIAYYVNTAFGQAATTFTSQNYAAKKTQRCRKIFWISLGMALLFSSLIIYPIVIFRSQASCIFSSSPEEIRFSCERILVVLSLQILCSVYEIPACTMRGLGYSALPAVEMILGICVIRIIWRFTIFSYFNTLKSMYLVFPTTWVITSIIMLISFVIVLRKAFPKPNPTAA
jgi:putative MATE family efflux protein